MEEGKTLAFLHNTEPKFTDWTSSSTVLSHVVLKHPRGLQCAVCLWSKCGGDDMAEVILGG